MKRIITYMVKYNDESFSIKMDIFEKPITETNIQLFLGEKEDEKTKGIKETYSHMPGAVVFARCHFISMTTLEG